MTSRRSPVSTTHGREGKGYEQLPGFCKAAKLVEIREHNYVLTPGGMSVLLI